MASLSVVVWVQYLTQVDIKTTKQFLRSINVNYNRNNRLFGVVVFGLATKVKVTG